MIQYDQIAKATGTSRLARLSGEPTGVIGEAHRELQRNFDISNNICGSPWSVFCVSMVERKREGESALGEFAVSILIRRR